MSHKKRETWGHRSGADTEFTGKELVGASSQAGFLGNPGSTAILKPFGIAIGIGIVLALGLNAIFG